MLVSREPIKLIRGTSLRDAREGNQTERKGQRNRLVGKRKEAAGGAVQEIG